jgi:putative ABC transport system permease protein
LPGDGPTVLLHLRAAFEQAMHNLRAHSDRAALTSAGITIAIAALIVTVGLSLGLRTSIDQRLGQLATQVTITPLAGRVGPGLRGAQPLTDADVAALRGPTAAPAIATVTPLVTGSALVRATGNERAAEVIGSTADYLAMANRELVAGRSFTPAEYARGERVVVLGPTLVDTLFAGDARRAVGREVRIGRTPFTVIGTLRPDGQQDGIALVPMSAARGTLRGHTDRVNEIIVTASAPDTVGDAVHGAQRILSQRHHIDDPARRDFSVTERGSLLASVIRFNRNLELFALLVAAVTLVLGGVGIANVMLVSVTERTSEIGLRRAVGASRGMITKQFLLESAVLAGAGGLNGVLAGVVVTLGAAELLPVAVPDYGTPRVSWVAVLVGFALSVVTGVIAGVYPARRAARLQPVDALQR